MISERRALLCLLAATALSTGCGKPAQGPPRGPVEVGTVTMRPERVVLTTELPGRTAAYLVAEVRPQVNGIIQRAEVRGGLRRPGGGAALPDRSGALPGGLRPGQGRARHGRGEPAPARSRAER